jgi:hypothetical protein
VPDADAACRFCGAAPAVGHADRCANGHLLPGNSRALLVGATSVAFWREHAAARREIAAALASDLGHSVDDAPRALLTVLDSIAQAQLVRDAAYVRLVELGGPLSSAGKVRRAFEVWLAAVDRLERHLRLVGLERRAKPVPTLEQLLRERETEVKP